MIVSGFGFLKSGYSSNQKKIKILGNYVLSFNWIIVHGLGGGGLGQQPKRRGGAKFLETLFYHWNKQKYVVQGS